MTSKPGPSLGRLVGHWVAAHCVVPDGRLRGAPFGMYRWQALCTFEHYRIKPTAKAGQLATAFSRRRSLIVGPQKIGKGPWSATITANEARGPAVFAGWAGEDDGYACSDHGCGCGFEYAYRPGDPMGEPWATPLIQLTATSEDQVANVYRPLQSMIRLGPLSDLMTVGEEFIRLGTDGRIDVVTSSAQSRLGQPVTFCLQDETGIWTRTNKMISVADTQRRGAAGMGGRTMETTNAPDPSVESQALATIRRAKQVKDIFVYHREPPGSLGEYADPVARRKIHEFAYEDCEHVDLDGIEAEAAELLIEDPRQAERFFGNRMVAGSAKWTTPEDWDGLAADATVKPAKRERITIGMDGSDGTAKASRVADSTVLRGCRLEDGFRFTIGIWEHQPDPDGEYSEWYVPRAEVMEKIRWAFAYYDVVLAGFDPPYWRNEIAELAEEFGEDRVIEFRTANDQLMASALQSLRKTDTKHDGCPDTRRHVLNAVTHVKEYRDDNDERKKLTLVSKPTKDSPDKIDALISDAIAHDMRNRAIAAGARKKKKARAIGF